MKDLNLNISSCQSTKEESRRLRVKKFPVVLPLQQATKEEAMYSTRLYKAVQSVPTSRLLAGR